MVCGMVLSASHESSSTKNTRKMSIKGSVCEEIHIKLTAETHAKNKKTPESCTQKFSYLGI